MLGGWFVGWFGLVWFVGWTGLDGDLLCVLFRLGRERGSDCLFYILFGGSPMAEVGTQVSRKLGR